MRIRRPSHATVVSYLALTLALSGTAYAATGGTFLLGKPNTASTQTTLTSTGGTPLVLNAKSGYAPLATNSTTKVNRLNADLLDGVDSAALQRRLITNCAQGSAVRAIAQNGTVACEVTKAKVIQTVESIDATPGSEDLGFGYAGCWPGYAVVGGGYVTGTGPNPPSALAEYATPLSFTDPETHERVDGYVVQLRNLDGTPYVGGGDVYAECVLGSSIDEPIEATPLQRRAPNALIKKYQRER